MYFANRRCVNNLAHSYVLNEQQSHFKATFVAIMCGNNHWIITPKISAIILHDALYSAVDKDLRVLHHIDYCYC